MGKLKAIVFDLDGTLYTSRELAAEIHRVACSAIALQLGACFEEAEARLAAAKRALVARSGREATLSAACQELGCDIRALHSYLAENVEPEPFLKRDERVLDMLARLARDYSLLVYTNNNRQLAGRIMAAIGVDSHMERLFTIEYCWRSKPDRGVLENIFAEIGVAPRECLFVGDRYDVDLRLPEEMGCRSYLTKSIDELLRLEGFADCGFGDNRGGE